jgi:hypothetical protein
VIFWGIDDGQVYGARRFNAHVGAVMVVHLAFATLLAQSERREATYGTMNLSPTDFTFDNNARNNRPLLRCNFTDQIRLAFHRVADGVGIEEIQR